MSIHILKRVAALGLGLSLCGGMVSAKCYLVGVDDGGPYCSVPALRLGDENSDYLKEACVCIEQADALYVPTKDYRFCVSPTDPDADHHFKPRSQLDCLSIVYSTTLINPHPIDHNLAASLLKSDQLCAPKGCG